VTHWSVDTLPLGGPVEPGHDSGARPYRVATLWQACG